MPGRGARRLAAAAVGPTAAFWRCRLLRLLSSSRAPTAYSRRRIANQIATVQINGLAVQLGSVTSPAGNMQVCRLLLRGAGPCVWALLAAAGMSWLVLQAASATRPQGGQHAGAGWREGRGHLRRASCPWHNARLGMVATCSWWGLARVQPPS